MARMITIALPLALYSALFAAVNGTPVPPGTSLPSTFALAPLYTPPNPLSSSPDSSDSAPHAQSVNSHIVRDSYIVVLHDHLSPEQIAFHQEQVSQIHASEMQILAQATLDADSVATTVPIQDTTFEGIKHAFHIGKKVKNGKTIKGYSGHFNERTLDAIRAMDSVKYVERDSLVFASDLEKGAPWGLARISHRKQLGFGTFNQYSYDGHGGEGVDAYVIDTGVNVGHVELEGRAKWGKTIPKDPDQDLNGHGSHVAGTIASAKYGVAKKANIIAVKVLGAGGSGTMSDVVAGVAWAADSASSAAELKAQGKNPKHKGSVANMSLGGGKSQALDDAVNAAVEDGLHFAVAAGNDNRDACSYSPAAAEGAITVGASSISDERAYFSNYGKCVDLFAPGLNIMSIWNTGNTSTNSISGTSMASPHVAGLAAYFLSLYPQSFSPSAEDFEDSVYDRIMGSTSASNLFKNSAQLVFGKIGQWTGMKKQSAELVGSQDSLSTKALKKAMVRVATKNALSDVGAGSPNILIFNNYTTNSK